MAPVKIYWNQAELTQLKNSFLRGESIKYIARGLGRTPTAVSKALSRYGIRCQRIRQPIYRPSSRTKKLYCRDIQRDFMLLNEPRWIKFDALLKWVSEEIGELHFRSIDPSSTPSPYGNKLYFIEKRNLNAFQLIQFVNEVRCARNLPIFYVEGLTVS